MEKLRIWLDFPIHHEAMRMLWDEAEVTGPFPKLDVPEAWSALTAADGAVISSHPNCNGAWMDKAPRLKVLARSGIGYDNVDVDAASNSLEGNWRMNMGAVTQVLEVLRDRRPQWLVNPEVWGHRRR